MEALCSEIGFLRKLQGDLCGALEMAVLAKKEELLHPVLAELPDAKFDHATTTRVAAALEAVVGPDYEVRPKEKKKAN